ncbi:amino acid ABC transporter permease, partial [Helicobacter pylori]|nr:amino acid ABC transporter permease [Helicobacter pylori]
FALCYSLSLYSSYLEKKFQYIRG